MGWDLVAIGLNHKLPLNNPSAIAECLGPLFKSPIEIGYYKEWEYDPKTKMINRPDKYEWKTISILNQKGESIPAKLTIDNKSAQNIFLSLNKSVSVNNFRDAADYDWFMECVLNPYCLYQLESADGDKWVRIFREIFEFEINIYFRWFQFTHLFYDYSPQNIGLIENLRDYIHWQCKLTGCTKIYLFPDQDYGDSLYDKINLTSEEWLKFMNNLYEEEMEKLNENDVVFKIKDYLNGSKILPQNRDVYCFFDECEKNEINGRSGS